MQAKGYKLTIRERIMLGFLLIVLIAILTDIFLNQ